jgi:hypothetical protein
MPAGSTHVGERSRVGAERRACEADDFLSVGCVLVVGARDDEEGPRCERRKDVLDVEVNLVELSEGTTVPEAVAWFREQSGPPPMRFRSGAAIKTGEEATTELDLQPGATYGFACAIPDVLGDFAPHVTKGMFTDSFSV